jgi:hypothetical protein
MAESIYEATERAVQAARAELSDLDAGAVAVLLELARQIEVMADNGGLREDGKLDNVSIPTYLRFCESLGLTPAGRVKLGVEKPSAGPVGKLASLKAHADKRSRSA